MKKLLIIGLIAYIGYSWYNHYTWQQTPAFAAYSSFNQALHDHHTASLQALGPKAYPALQTTQPQRKALYAGLPKWSCIRKLSETQTPETITWRLQVITRIDRPDQPSSLIGHDTIWDQQLVTLRDHHGQWQVEAFEDQSSRGY